MYHIENKEIQIIDPTKLGLSSRTTLGQLSENHFVIIKDRKSRIIMKDGQQLFKQIQTIQRNAPEINVSIATNAPICGKTIKYFEEKGIILFKLEK